MSLITVGGYRVHRARVSMPLRGAWVADAAVEATTLVDGERIQVTAPGLALKGASYRSGFYADLGTVRLVAGAGGLVKELRATSYRRVRLRHCLEDIARETGETLSPTCDLVLMSTFIERWTRPRGTGADGLAALLTMVPGVTWRILDDGSIWVGRESWPAFAGKFQVLEDDPAAGRLVLASETAELRPGVLIDGRRVTHVEHSFESSKVRTEVEYSVDEDRSSTERLLESFSELVRRIMQGVRLHVRYLGAVVSQAADGSVGVKFDRDAVAGTDGIPLRLGLPGFRVKVPAGVRLAVGFEEGDAARPAVVGFDQGSQVTEVAFDHGTKAVARVDDAITAGTISWASPVAGSVAVSFTPPGGAPVLLFTLSVAAGVLGVAPATGSTELVGKVTSGNTKLKA